MKDTQSKLRIPRWLLIGTAICVLVPDFILLYQLAPAFRVTHHPHPDIQAMSDSPAVAHIGTFSADLVRPIFSMFVAWGILRRRFLTLAAVYLALRIVVPLLLAMRAPQIFDWSFAPIVLHGLALTGIIYIRRFNEPSIGQSVAPV